MSAAWRSFEHDPPPEGLYLVVRAVNGQRYLDIRAIVADNGAGLRTYNSWAHVTHWMELPALPEAGTHA